MACTLPNKGGRVMPGGFDSAEEYLLYLRHLFAYKLAKSMIPENSSILDFGFGEGYGSALLASKAKKVIGIDIEQDVVMHASEKYASRNCFFEPYSCGSLKYPSESFDAVVSFQVIEHIEDDTAAISEIYRVLRPGGFFMISTPNRILRLRPGQRPWNIHHLREYDSEDLTSLLKTRFSEVKLLGVMGNDEIQKMELARLRRISHLTYIDYFQLRAYLPQTIKKIFLSLIGKPILRNFDTGYSKSFDKFRATDYYTVETGLDDCLDLIAVCRKSP